MAKSNFEIAGTTVHVKTKHHRCGQKRQGENTEISEEHL